ncbi:MAG TPA: PKD domain-containing protein, partial [Chitinophagaceae bacterium]|nr:PKD domain-containing protein [Chitinophagaceae bacterium]
VLCDNTVELTSDEVEVYVNQPGFLEVYDGNRCGDGEVVLHVQPTESTTEVNWYASETDDIVLGTGNTFITDPLTDTDTFWAEASTGTPQNETAWIGDGTTMSTTSSTPFYNLYEAHKLQVMFTAQELIDADFDAGLINSISINVGTAGSRPLSNFVLKVGTTTESDLNSAFISNMTEVYSDPSLTPTINSANEFVFDTPYQWDGVSNVVLEFCYVNNDWGSPYYQVETSSVSGNYTRYQYADNNPNHCSNPTGSNGSTTTRINVAFNITKGCPGERVPVIANVNPTNDDPIIDLGDDGDICSDVLLDAGSEGVSYLWSTWDTTQTITPEENTSYWVQVTNADGCTSFDTIDVENFLPLVEIDDIVANEIGVGEFEFEAIDVENADNYTWDFGDGNTSNDENPTHTYADNGNYTVTLTVSNECNEETVSHEIEVTDIVGINEIFKENINLYPNPANNYIIIENGGNLQFNSITLLNSIGQEVLKDNNPNLDKHQIDISKLNSGTYMIRIETNNGILYHKVEVIK